MYIIGKSTVDKQGRVVISGLFKEPVQQVVIVTDPETEMILLLPVSEGDPSFGVPLNVDSKNRIFLPKWIKQELGDHKDLLLIVDNDKHYLSPKTGYIIAGCE